MPEYTNADFARDQMTRTLPDLLGSLNVARFDLKRVTKLKKARTLTRAEWHVQQACRIRIPILEAELARRGETIPAWLYPASMFPDVK